MNQNEWLNLKYLSELKEQERLSGLGMDNYYTLLYRTERVREHPEGYNGPCMCQMCMSYADYNPLTKGEE